MKILALLTVVYAFDDSIKECWDVTLKDDSYFCYGSVGWPLSKTVYYEQTSRDECNVFVYNIYLDARSLYDQVKEKWKGEKT